MMGRFFGAALASTLLTVIAACGLNNGRPVAGLDVSAGDGSAAGGGNDYTAQGAQTQDFGGSVDPQSFGGQTSPSDNEAASTSGQNMSTLSGIGDGSPLQFLEVVGTASQTIGLPAMTRWYCGYHDRRFGPLAGALQILGFNPRWSNGWTLEMRPPKSHCTGIGVKVFLFDLGNGDLVDLPCRASGTGSCYRGTFEIPIGSKPSWKITPEDLRDLTGRGPYALAYVWVHNTEGSCSGSGKASFGIGIHLRKGNVSSAPAITCPYF